MIYFVSTFLVLVGIFVFIVGERKLSFYISMALWLMKYDAFDFSGDHTIVTSLFGWGVLILIQHPTTFWGP